MGNQLVLSVMADDRPGVVEQLAATVADCQGNWLESALSRLGGKFAGIVLVDVPDEKQTSLESALATLRDKGIRVALDVAGAQTVSGETVTFEVIGNDRRGIVGEISHVLAKHGVSVDELYTSTERAPMSGELLFRTTANVVLPADMTSDAIQQILEELSDDLMVEFFDD